MIYLKISQDSFNLYSDNIVEFWDELPERSFSNEFEIDSVVLIINSLSTPPDAKSCSILVSLVRIF